MSSLVHCTTCLFFGLCGVAASSLVGLYDLALVSVASPFVKKALYTNVLLCSSVKFIHVGLRVSLFVHAHLVLQVIGVVAPRSLRDFVSLRNSSNLLLA